MPTSLVRIAEHHRPFARLADMHGREVQERCDPLGYQDLTFQRMDRLFQVHFLGQLCIAQAGGQHQLFAVHDAGLRMDREPVLGRIDTGDPRIAVDFSAQRQKGRLHGPHRVKRADMAVMFAVGPADHLRADFRNVLPQFVAGQHLVLEPAVLMRRQRIQLFVPVGEFLLAEAEVDAAAAAEGEVYSGTLGQFLGEGEPGIGRFHRPVRIDRGARPFALHPDQTEVSAGGAQGGIALVQNYAPHSLPRQSIGDR